MLKLCAVLYYELLRKICQYLDISQRKCNIATSAGVLRHIS